MSTKRKATATASVEKKTVRKILFPTERTSIPRAQIRRAVQKVAAEMRAAETVEASRK